MYQEHTQHRESINCTATVSERTATVKPQQQRDVFKAIKFHLPHKSYMLYNTVLTKLYNDPAHTCNMPPPSFTIFSFQENTYTECV